nr:MAG TPA: hypothetical protein [Caudoviricetes sp.]
MPFMPEKVHGTDKAAARLLDMPYMRRFGAVQLLEAARRH